MKLITMKCPNCHANVEVEDNKKEFFCSYCRMTTKIDEEIVKVEVIDKDLDKELKVAKTYLEDFEDYEKAFKTYQEISLRYPYEPEVWLGMILSRSRDLSFDNPYLYTKTSFFSLYKEIKEYYDRYKILEKDSSRKDENISDIDSYLEEFEEEIEKIKKEESIVNNIAIGIFITIGVIFLLIVA